MNTLADSKSIAKASAAGGKVRMTPSEIGRAHV